MSSYRVTQCSGDGISGAIILLFITSRDIYYKSRSFKSSSRSISESTWISLYHKDGTQEISERILARGIKCAALGFTLSVFLLELCLSLLLLLQGLLALHFPITFSALSLDSQYFLLCGYERVGQRDEL